MTGVNVVGEVTTIARTGESDHAIAESLANETSISASAIVIVQQSGELAARHPARQQ
jgi:uncharacterized protein YggU (UPF0235/DUF167 family)